MEKSSTGLDTNVAGLLCYVLGWVSGLVFILIEKESKFVRFHAIQSIYVFGILHIIFFAVRLIFSWIPIMGQFIFGALASVIGLICFVLWIVLMIKAYQGEKYKLPMVGDWAEKRSG